MRIGQNMRLQELIGHPDPWQSRPYHPPSSFCPILSTNRGELRLRYQRPARAHQPDAPTRRLRILGVWPFTDKAGSSPLTRSHRVKICHR
jgi:hypothetical protein